MGPMVGMSIKWPMRPMVATPMARPNTAVRIGRPMATSDPKVKAIINIAVSRPITSLDSVDCLESAAPTGPPTATSIPIALAGFVAASKTTCAVASSSWPLSISSSTGMKA